MGGHLLRLACYDDMPSLIAALRAQVDDPVSRFDHLEVVLDHYDGVASIGQAVQDLQELADIVEVQPGGRLIQDIQGLAGPSFAEFPRQLDPLRLTARERRGQLAQCDI